jgi:sugar phosphate isomerase/epimerase
MLGRESLVLSSGSVENPAFPDLIEAAQAGGYQAITLWPGDYHPSSRGRLGLAEMRTLVEASGLVVRDVDAVVLWVGEGDPGGPYFEEAPEREVLELADAVGAQGVNVLLHGEREISFASAVDALGSFSARAAEHGLYTCLEFSRKRCPADIPSAARLVEATGRSDAGLTIDAWHVHYGPGSFGDLDALAGERIGAVQLSDAPARRPDDLGWATRYQRLVPGEGVIEGPEVLRRLRAIGSQSPLTLEVFDAQRVERLGATGFACQLADAARTWLNAST